MKSILERRSSAVLLGSLLFGIVTLWIPQFWPTAIFRVGIFGLSLVWAIAIGTGRVGIRFSPAAYVLAGAALWPLVQLAAQSTISRWETAGYFWTSLINLLVFLLAAQVASDPGRLRSVLQFLVYFSAGLSVVSTVQMFTSGGRVFWSFPTGYNDFVLGPFVYRNQYAAFIELMLPIPLFLAIFDSNKRLAYSLMATVMAGSVIASSSRAGAVLVAAELVAVPMIAATAALISWRTAGAVLAKIFVLASAAVAVVGYEPVWRRLMAPDPYFMRREISLSALHMLREHAGMGFGLGNWAVAYPHYATFDPGALMNQAHNDWLQWGVEGGIPYLLLMLAFAALIFRPAVHTIWGIGVIGVLLHALVDYPLQQRPALAAVFFAVAGMVTHAEASLGSMDLIPRHTSPREGVSTKTLDRTSSL